MSAVKFLRKNIDGCFPYIREVEKILNKHEKNVDNDLIREVCLRYQKGLKCIARKDYKLSKKDRWRIKRTF